jgi:hypothetical protein
MVNAIKISRTSNVILLERTMKLHLFLAIMDLLSLLAYPILYIVHRARKKMGDKK